MSAQTANDWRDRFEQYVRNANLRRVGTYALLVLLVGFYLAPLYGGVMTSVKNQAAFFTTIPFEPPTSDGFTTDGWRTAWGGLSHAVVNSVILVIPATILSALLGSLAAYGLTNLDWKGQVPVMLLFVVGIFIPYQAVLVPVSQLWSIVDTAAILGWFGVWRLPGLGSEYADLVNLIITHTAYGIPITTLLFRSYYKKFSDEMLEAARLDGASVASIYWNIILPLSKPMFAVTLIYQFTQIWNDLLFALIVVGSGSTEPVTVALNNLAGAQIQQFNVQMAGAFIAALPTLLVYIFFGDKFAKGVAGDT